MTGLLKNIKVSEVTDGTANTTAPLPRSPAAGWPRALFATQLQETLRPQDTTH